MSRVASVAPLSHLPLPWRQTAVITALALGVYGLVRWLPLADGGLHYTDFGAGQRGFLEFCEPGTPQFAPVDRVRSPVELEVEPGAPLQAGRPSRVVVRLATASGKPVIPEDLLVMHTRPLHLLIVDSTLEDYQHMHPEPAAAAGAFAFDFTPRRSGRYRVFADFMPRATGRALYAGAALDVQAGAEGPVGSGVDPYQRSEAVVDGVHFSISFSERPVRLNETATLVLTIGRTDGTHLELEDVMDAPAHVVVFDERCSGFAHLHPLPPSADLAGRSDAGRRLAFSINLADPGYYRLWAQVRVDGQDRFVPFGFTAEP